MTAVRRYSVVLTPEDDGGALNVVIPALPGCFTWGATVEEALAMARDAISLCLADERDAPAPDGEKAIFATVTVDGPERIPA